MSKKKSTKYPAQGAKVVVDGAFQGTFIGVAESGRWIVDVGGSGTVLVAPERAVVLA